ncbi:MAG: hypothetical protein WC147_05225 [Syntrophomonas sp.]
MAGTVLTWIPILFTVIISVIGTISARTLRFDYLMPAELFPVVLAGTLLLLWAALRAHSHQKLIGWGLVATVVFLVGGQVFAVISGLASGAVEPTGWSWSLVVASIALYSLALIEIAIAGLLLVRKLY